MERKKPGNVARRIVRFSLSFTGTVPTLSRNILAMKYTEFRDTIRKELSRHRCGKTWKELRDDLGLPYRSPCPEWVGRLEKDISLDRSEKRGNACLWKLSHV